MIRKIALLLTVCLLLSLTVAFTACSDSGATPTESETAEPTEKPTAKPTSKPTARPTEDGGNDVNGKSIDIYLIAGQSNGSGYTRTNMSTLMSLWQKAAVGNANVLYAGRAEYTSNGSTMANEMIS